MTERVLVLAQDGLGDPSPVVRFVALMAVGQKNLGSLGPMAVAMTQDPSRNVQAAAIFAAYKTGARQDLSRLAGFLASSDPGLRRNTAMLLGLVGDTSAIPMIRELSARPMRRATAQEAELAQIEAAKAMVLLGDDESLEIVEAGAFSGFGEVRVISIMALGELDDRRMQPALNRMLSVGMPEQAPEVRIAAAEAMARMGFAAGLDVLIEASQQQFIPYEGRQIPAELLRVQSARGLGLIQDVRAATALGRLLNDPNPQVRLSAAGAVIAAWARLDAGRLR